MHCVNVRQCASMHETTNICRKSLFASMHALTQKSASMHPLTHFSKSLTHFYASMDDFLTFIFQFRTKHRRKICSRCGKVETNNWAKHWRERHPKVPVRKELVKGARPLEEPHCDNWEEIVEAAYIVNSVLPEEKNSRFPKKGFRADNKHGSKSTKSDALFRKSQASQFS
jgi:hypothetical protein